MEDLQRQTVSGVVWAAGSRVGQQVLQFGVTVVLARLLGPDEFGLFGMIAVFAGFASLFVDFGLTAALVQRKEVDERHLSSAFWMNVAAGSLLTIAMAAAAPALAAFYGQPRLTALTMVLALNFALSSLVVVQTALLLRAMSFKRLAAIEVCASLISGAVAIGAALEGLGVWSLVIQALVATCVRGAGLWLTTSWRPQLRVNREAAGELWRFSGHLSGFTALNYWSRNADNLLVGKFVGAAGLGIYARAYSTMLLPLSQVSAVVTRVMFPALSRIQDERQRVKRAYLRSLGMIGLVTFPVAIGLIVVAKPFVLTLYGPAWAGVAPILQILCLAGLTQSIGTTVGWIYQSQGRTDWMLRWGLVATTATFLAFGIGILWGIKGIAIAYVIRTYLLTYFNFSIPGKLVDMRFRDVVHAIRHPLAAATAMGGIVWLAGLALPASWPPAATLFTQVAVGSVVYLALAHTLALKPYRDLREIAAHRIRPRRAVRLST